MTSRERVRLAIQHREPDRVPLDLGATPVTGIAASTYAKLRQALGFAPTPVKVWEPFQILAEVELEVLQKLGVDVIGLNSPVTMFGYRNENWKPWKLFDGTEVLVGEKFVVREDEKGDILIYPQGDTSVPPSGRLPKGGFYFDAIIRQQPIDEAHLDPQEFAEQYTLYTDEDLEYFQRTVDQLYYNTDLSIVGGFWQGGFGDIAQVPGPGLKHPKGIRDPQEWYIAHVTHPNYIYEIFAIQCEVALENLKLYYQAVGDKIDVIVVSGTDFGAQHAAFISPDMYRQLYKPFHQQLNDWIHANTPWKVFFHSCGSVVDFLDDFIDAGVDILNPVQCSAAGMDPMWLKENYGDKLVFWGGGVDTQKTLPFGTPDQVRQEVADRIRIFAPGGGFVFNTIHNIQQGTPVENLLAMYETVKERGQYPIVNN
ncbi:methyltransferase [candidate division KSB1 bacterium]|nr:methyltransferase [bacterium]RKY77173.1 MAG: methyltransferase [candidate division KSB1 bacterium]